MLQAIHFSLTNANKRYNLSKNGGLQNSPARSFLNEKDEMKIGFRREPDRYGVYRWVFRQPEDSGETAPEELGAEAPSVALVKQLPAGPQRPVESTPEPSRDVVATRAVQDVVERPKLATSNNFPPPQRLLPPPAPTFEMVCAELATMKDSLRSALLIFLQMIDQLDDVSVEMLFLGESFKVAFRGLRQYRNVLRLEESKSFGWGAYIAEFYLKIHPQVRALGLHYDKDMLEFLRAVLTFGRFLGLQLPDLDLSPPPQPAPQSIAPPAMLVFPDTHPFQPSTKPAMPTKAIRARLPPPPPTQQAPAQAPAREQQKMVQASFALPPPPPMAAAPTLMNFDDLIAWHDLSEEQMLALTFASFGWTDEKTARFKIWTFSAAKDFMLSGTKADWTNTASVKKKPVEKARAFKRASVVLHMQAKADDFDKLDISMAPLLNEITAFIRNAKDMTDTPFASRATGWMLPETFHVACLFHHNELHAEEVFISSLKKHYGRKKFWSWTDQWDEVVDAWLPEPK